MSKPRQQSRPTPYQVALLVATLFKSARGHRARISEKTIRRLSRRTALRTTFLNTLEFELDDIGIAMIEMDRGYALVSLTALEGAPALTVKTHLPDFSWRTVDFAALEKKLGLEPSDEDDGDEP